MPKRPFPNTPSDYVAFSEDELLKLADAFWRHHPSAEADPLYKKLWEQIHRLADAQTDYDKNHEARMKRVTVDTPVTAEHCQEHGEIMRAILGQGT